MKFEVLHNWGEEEPTTDGGEGGEESALPGLHEDDVSTNFVITERGDGEEITDMCRNNVETEHNDCVTVKRNVTDSECGSGAGRVECDINRKTLSCITHSCKVKKTKISSLKWNWIPRKKEYGFVPRKVTKYICSGRNCVRGDPDIFPAVTSESPDGATSGEKIITQHGISFESESNTGAVEGDYQRLDQR